MSIIGILGAAEGLFSLFREGIALIPNENKRRELEAALAVREAEFVATVNASQMEVNKLEAISPSRFVSWWRPACGWVCVLGFAVAFLLRPVAEMVVSVFWPGTYIPDLDVSTLTTMLLGLLGLGGLRSFDKRALTR